MSRSSATVLTFALLASLAGCQADWSLRGHVVAAGSTDAVTGAPAPIAYAKVILHCASQPDLVVQTDRSGAFELTGAGEGPRLDCKVAAIAPGHAEWTASVDEICADDGEGEGRCANGAVVAELSPAE